MTVFFSLLGCRAPGVTLFAQVPYIVVVKTTLGWDQGLRATDEGGSDHSAGFLRTLFIVGASYQDTVQVVSLCPVEKLIVGNVGTRCLKLGSIISLLSCAPKSPAAVAQL